MPAAAIATFRARLALVIVLIAGVVVVHIDWHWKRPLSPRAGVTFFIELSFRCPHSAGTTNDGASARRCYQIQGLSPSGGIIGKSSRFDNFLTLDSNS